MTDVRHTLTWSLATGPAGTTIAEKRHWTARSWRRIAAGAIALLLAALLGVSAARWATSPVATPPANRLTLAVSPPDNVRITGAVALSPDGRQFAFVGQAPDAPPSLWLRSLESGTTRQLEGTDDPLYPFWAPQSDTLGFFADGRLKVVALAGGPSRVLATAPNGRGGSWGPDGTILFVPEPNNPVFKVSSVGGSVAQVTTLNSARGEVGHRFPEHLDAARFIYTNQAGSADVAGVYQASLDGAQPTRLVAQYSNATVEGGHLLYVDNGAIVARPFDSATGTLGSPVTVAAPIAAGGFGYSAFSALTGREQGGARSISDAEFRGRPVDRRRRPRRGVTIHIRGRARGESGVVA